MDLSKFTQGFLLVVTWISKIVAWIYLSCHTDSSKLLYIFLALCHAAAKLKFGLNLKLLKLLL